MKKRFAALLLAAAAVVSLAGCGQTKSLAYLKNIKASDYVELSDDYNHVTVEVPAETEVTDEMVESTINYKLSSSAAYQEVTDHDTVKKGDTVNIDYTGTKDGKEFSGGSAKDYDLTIGSGSFIDGFEDGLIGHKKGENVTLNLTFPKDYSNTDLAGQDVVFKVTINKIEKLVTPELTDEWVAEQNIDGVSTVDAYRDYTRKQMQSYYDDSHKSDIQEAIVKKLLKSCTFVKDPPAEMVQRYYDNMVQSYTQQLSQSYGIDLDTYTKLMGLDDESSGGSTEDAATAGTEQAAAAGTSSSASEASSSASDKTGAETSDTAVTEAAAQSSSAVTSEEVSSSQSTAASIQDIVSSDSSSSDAAQGSTEANAASSSAVAGEDSTESASTASTEAASDSTTAANAASGTKEYKWIRDDAVEMARRYIILQAIADKENLNLTTRELKTELSTEAAKEGYSDLDTYLKDEENSNSYREYLMSQRVLDWLVDHATVKTLSADESADNASDESSSTAATEDAAADETAAEASTASTEADTEESSESSEIGDSGAGMGY